MAATKRSTKNRSTKKTTKKAAPRKVKSVDALHLRIKGTLKMEMRAVAAEIDAAEKTVTVSVHKLAALSTDPVHAPVFLAMSDRDNAVADYNAKKKDLIELQKRIAKKLDIPIEEFHKYSIDTTTGIVTQVPGTPN